MLQSLGGDIRRPGTLCWQGLEDRSDGEQCKHQDGAEGAGRLQRGTGDSRMEGLKRSASFYTEVYMFHFNIKIKLI